MQHRKNSSAEILKVKRREEKKNNLYIFLSVSVFLVIVFVIFANFNDFKVDQIVVKGLKYGKTETISNFIRQEISDNFFWILPKNNIYLLPQKSIQKKIVRTFDFVISIQIKLEDRNVVAEIIEKIPVAVWCESRQKDSKCFLLTSTGFLIAEEPDIFDPETTRFFGKLEKDQEKGEHFSTPDDFQRIIQFLEEIKKLGIRPRYVETEDQETYKVQTIGGTSLLINVKDKTEEVLENLKTLLKNESIGEIQLKNIEYIDLRFGNKVYYKPR